MLSHVFELRAEIRIFLEEERTYEAASKFSDELFLLKLTYLSDVFGKLNELNLQLQGKDKHLLHLADKNHCTLPKSRGMGQAPRSTKYRCL